MWKMGYDAKSPPDSLLREVGPRPRRSEPKPLTGLTPPYLRESSTYRPSNRTIVNRAFLLFGLEGIPLPNAGRPLFHGVSR